MIERNQFTAKWLDAAKEAGFTEKQLEFLEQYYIHECSPDCML
jgi:hypothetical protein